MNVPLNNLIYSLKLSVFQFPVFDSTFELLMDHIAFGNLCDCSAKFCNRESFTVIYFYYVVSISRHCIRFFVLQIKKGTTMVLIVCSVSRLSQSHPFRALCAIRIQTHKFGQISPTLHKVQKVSYDIENRNTDLYKAGVESWWIVRRRLKPSHISQHLLNGQIRYINHTESCHVHEVVLKVL